MNVQIAGREYTTFVNGPGCRSVIFFSGCRHSCKSCHNIELWSYSYGRECNVTDIVNEIKKYKDANLIQGVTISGGEPFDQPLALEAFVYELGNIGVKDIWVYTGYTFQEAIDISPKTIQNISVLVDGKFDITKRDEACRYKGSHNQRIIDCHATVESMKEAEQIKDYNEYIKLYNLEDLR